MLLPQILHHRRPRCYTWKAPRTVKAVGAPFPKGELIMPDPVIRRLSCSAVLYLEPTPDGLCLARLVVDLPLPEPSALIASLPSSFGAPEDDSGWPPSPDVEATAAAKLLTFPAQGPAADLNAGGL